MKSQLIKVIQDLSGVTSVEPFHISPDEPNQLFCIVTFDEKELRLSPEEVQRRNYNAQIRRETITDKTTKLDFVYKCREELNELEMAIINNDEENEKEERADVMHVMEAMAYRYAHDIQKEKELKMLINEKRK